MVRDVPKTTRGQMSVEYLIIIGVALAVLIPGILFFYSYSQSNIGATTTTRINEIGLKVIATAQTTYGLGRGAWQTVEFNMPTTVSSVKIVNGKEFVITYDTPYGSSDAVFFSIINLTNASLNEQGIVTAPHPGLTRFRITSYGTNVSINETA